MEKIMRDQNIPASDTIIDWERAVAKRAGPAVPPPTPMASLWDRLLGGFAFAAACLYPECIIAVMAINEVVTQKTRPAQPCLRIVPSPSGGEAA
jgi:hypothetical protein